VDATGRVAVLAVIIAGVVALMVEKGDYTWGNTVFGLTLLALLIAYDAPKASDTLGERELERPFQSVTYGAAWALCIMNTFGPLLQHVPLYPSCCGVEWKELFGWLSLADVPFFAVWLVLTFGAFRVRRRRRFGM